MSLRISVIARWAATPSTCEFAKAVEASTTVAAPAARASVGSSSQCPWVMTSSIRYFVVVGRTKPDRRLISIRPRPSARRLRCVQMMPRASSHAPAVNAFLEVFDASSWPAARAIAPARGVRSEWRTGLRTTHDTPGGNWPEPRKWVGRLRSDHVDIPPRPQVRGAPARQDAGVHRRGRAVARARNRREHDDFHAGERGAPEPAAGRGSVAARVDLDHG